VKRRRFNDLGEMMACLQSRCSHSELTLARVRLMPTAADALTTYYATVLDGRHDCVDRIVLNAIVTSDFVIRPVVFVPGGEFCITVRMQNWTIHT
jgi:hypothetical protein